MFLPNLYFRWESLWHLKKYRQRLSPADTVLLFLLWGSLSNMVESCGDPPRTECRPADDRPYHPPEGGWGVVVVIAAHLSLAIQLSLPRSFGIMYLSFKDEFDANDKETAVVQGILTSMSNFGCKFLRTRDCRLQWVNVYSTIIGEPWPPWRISVV